MNSLVTTLEQPQDSMQPQNIQGFSYADRQNVLHKLGRAISECGAWVQDRRSISPATMQIQLEIQSRGVLDLYAALIASGLELTRDGHLALTSLCNGCKNSSGAIERTKLITVRLEITFLEDVTLEVLLMTGSALA
jgi:hypothetical protein